MDNVNHSRLEHMIGGPLSEHLVRAFARIEAQANAANGESHPRGWILALCNEVAYLSGRIAQLEEQLDPSPSTSEGIDLTDPKTLDKIGKILVRIKGVDHPAVFVSLSPKGWFRVRIEGEEKIRVVAPDKVFING